MVLKDIHDKIEDIPEQFQELYTEKNGKFELTGIQGVKTQADVDRIDISLRKERIDHKETKERLGIWDGLDFDDVTSKLDEIPHLQTAAKKSLDDAEVEELVRKRVEGELKSKVAPGEKKIKELEKQLMEIGEENGQFKAQNRTRRIHDAVRKVLVASKVLPGAQEDAMLLADRVFEIREDDGSIVTRDQVGITPGLDAAGWLTEIQESKRHWWPESVGGGAKGSGPGVGGVGGSNPWSAEHWNMTKQGTFLTEHGTERATAMAKAAGTTIGGRKPMPKKAASV